MGWAGINCYGMGMGQINMSHGQPWQYLIPVYTYFYCSTSLFIKKTLNLTNEKKNSQHNLVCNVCARKNEAFFPNLSNVAPI